MPWYRFIIHGDGILTGEGSTGFFTTRTVSAPSQERGAEMALAAVREAWISGEYAGWSPTLPSLSIDSGWEIDRADVASAPNKGSTFYSEASEAH
jgi:hypothetical protein